MTENQASSEEAATEGADSQNASAGTGRIVVGVDGSAGSMAALEWAVREAGLRGGSIHAVMAWQQPQTYGVADVSSLGIDPALDTQSVLASAAADLAARMGEQAVKDDDVAVSWEAVEGHSALALLHVAEGAEMLVVGSRGHGGFVGALLGSVSQHVVTHAPCPVVVIPDPRKETHGQHREDTGRSYSSGVFRQAHEHQESEHGQGVYEQGHAEPPGQGTYGQGHEEAGGGVYEQGRPDAEDV